jgi:hypothetical protein
VFPTHHGANGTAGVAELAAPPGFAVPFAGRTAFGAGATGRVDAEGRGVLGALTDGAALATGAALTTGAAVGAGASTGAGVASVDAGAVGGAADAVTGATRAGLLEMPRCGANAI